jgi:hypothetical protein
MFHEAVAINQTVVIFFCRTRWAERTSLMPGQEIIYGFWMHRFSNYPIYQMSVRVLSRNLGCPASN